MMLFLLVSTDEHEMKNEKKWKFITHKTKRNRNRIKSISDINYLTKLINFMEIFLEIVISQYQEWTGKEKNIRIFWITNNKLNKKLLWWINDFVKALILEKFSYGEIDISVVETGKENIS